MNLLRLSHQEDNAAGGLCSKFDSDLRRKIVVLDEFRVARLMNEMFSFQRSSGQVVATHNYASRYLGYSKPFPIVLNKTILIVFTLNCNAWKLKKVAALSAITDFHTHFANNLFTYWVYTSRCTF